jgi:hypothetical protein
MCTYAYIRTYDRALNDTLDGLNDAEVLLNRAVRIKQSQTDSLPLFLMLAEKDSEVTEVRLDLLVCAITALMDVTYDQRCAFFFNLFDAKGDCFYSGPFLAKVIMLFGEAFHRMKMLPFSPLQEDVVNSVLRGFLDIGLQYKTDSLTLPESKRLMITLVSDSLPLSNTLAVTLGFSAMKVICIYIYVYIYIYIYIYICMYIKYINVHVCMYIYIYTYM